MKELDHKQTTRAAAFELWMSSPMPMVTLTKSFDITRLRRISKRKGVKLNMLLCWCIGRAATQVEEFYTLPVKEKMVQYDSLAINVIVNNSKGGINSCDIAYTDDIEQFAREYNQLTAQAATRCESSFLEDSMIVGTSAMIATELDCIVNQYTDKFCNPMLMWGKYRRRCFGTTLPISFQFHHVQMDGGHAAKFLAQFQQVMNEL